MGPRRCALWLMDSMGEAFPPLEAGCGPRLRCGGWSPAPAHDLFRGCYGGGPHFTGALRHLSRTGIRLSRRTEILARSGLGCAGAPGVGRNRGQKASPSRGSPGWCGLGPPSTPRFRSPPEIFSEHICHAPTYNIRPTNSAAQKPSPHPRSRVPSWPAEPRANAALPPGVATARYTPREEPPLGLELPS